MSKYLFEFSFLGAPYLMAILLGFIVPIAIVVSGGLASKWSDSSKIAVMLGALLLGNALGFLLNGRMIYSQEEMALNPLLLVPEADSGRGAWAGRISTAIILFVSLGEIFRWATGARKMSSDAKSLWFAFLAFYLASYWVGVAFATSRDIPLSLIYSPIAFTALALLAQEGLNQKALVKIEWVFGGILAASLIGAAIVPNLTVEHGYKSWIPGLSFRLYGFSDHANTLGSIAALAVIFQLSPYIRKKPNLIAIAIAFSALVFTQSKTAWVVALVGIALVRFESFRGKSLRTEPGRFPLLVLFAVSMFGAAILIFLMLAANFGWLSRFLNFQDAVTFTGRTRIWEISWNELLKNPLFGYGPALWDLPYRYQNNFMVAGQAHNQFFQTAGQAGLIGLTSWFGYVYLLGRKCSALWVQTSGLALISFITLMVRCFSESPMRLGGLGGMDAFVHVLAFTFAASLPALSTHGDGSSRRHSNGMSSAIELRTRRFL